MSDRQRDFEQVAASNLDPTNLIQNHLDRGDASGWFDEFYGAVQGNGDAVPWACLRPRPAFLEWAEAHELRGEGRRAAVVACGLGDDAEELARRGFDVTAFDISPTAIAWAQQRFRDSVVNYRVDDLFNPSQQLTGGFDFVLEIFTVQALPVEMRARTVEAIAGLVAPSGELFVYSLGVPEETELSGPPWPLTRSELARFGEHGLRETSFERLTHPDREGLGFRAVYRRER